MIVSYSVIIDNKPVTMIDPTGMNELGLSRYLRERFGSGRVGRIVRNQRRCQMKDDKFKQTGDYTNPGKMDHEETMTCKICGDLYRGKYDRCQKCLKSQAETMRSYFRKG